MTKQMQMNITYIKCNATCSSFEGHDDVFLLIQADAGPPVRYPSLGSIKMSAGDTMELPVGGYVVNFDYGVVVTAWDLDSVVFKSINAPDYLFNIWVYNQTTSGTETKVNNNGANYTVTRNITS